MNDLLKKMKEVKMTDAEKQKGFDVLKSFITQNQNVHSPYGMLLVQKISSRIKSSYQEDFFFSHKLFASAFVIVFLISLTSGTSIAAKYSLPGDILYPIKINLNEKLESFTSLSTLEKAVVEARHVQTRLVEAEELDTLNRFDGDQKIEFDAQFKQDLESTITHINTLTASGETKTANEVKAGVEISLQKHKNIVNKILDRRNNIINKLGTVAATAKVELLEATGTRIHIKSSDSYISSSSVEYTSATEANFEPVSPYLLKMEVPRNYNAENGQEDTPLLREVLDNI